MIDTITENQFTDEMVKHGFSYEGTKVLFEYLDESNPNAEFDPVGIRCEFSEYDNLEEIQEQYNSSSMDINSIVELREHTTVLEIPNTDRLIIVDF